MDGVQAGLFGSQVGRGVFLGSALGRRPFGAGEDPQSCQVVGLAFCQGPGQAQLWRPGHHRGPGRREGLQVDTGRLPPQLLQLADRRIAFRLLLRPLGLPSGTLQLRR
ncbi:hypothetical protein MBT84_47950 [Streptomyces sp. MBT84]|nr:hypothetical protein [Streptomyces sp. MBT84]